MRLRQIIMGLQTVLGLRQRGFFIPYRYADTLPKSGTGPDYIKPYAPMLAAMAAKENEMAALVQNINGYGD
ncbi:MAG: hypothetical protein HOG12_11005, partial [Alphaproteobacteria bacterium]|nr:hypothetical protein [Alphaproteobacteria bacterium]